MNAVVPMTVDLADPDIEGVVLGSLISYPAAMQAVGDEIAPEWFTDPAARMFFDAARELHREGHRLSPPLLISRVTPAIEQPGATRAQFIASVLAMAMPLANLSGCLSTLRDRWARRMLNAQADAMKMAATSLEASPFDIAADTITVLDGIGSSDGAESAVFSLHQADEKLFEAIRSVDDQHRVTTGLPVLDEMLNGYAPGKLYVIAGRPGMGKSAFACSSLRRTAAAGWGVKLFSLEMGAEEIAARCLADALGDPRAPGFGDLQKGRFDPVWQDRLADAHEAHKALPLSVDATPGLTYSQIASRSRRFKARLEAQGKRLGVVAIDHMGLVSPSDRYKGNKVAETGELSRAGKNLAKELGCCVLLLSQLSRGVEGREDKQPSLADLRWSGDIEQDADVVAFLYRENYYLAQKPDADPSALLDSRNRLDFLIRKNRNGETRDVRLWCSIAHSSIQERRA